MRFPLFSKFHFLLEFRRSWFCFRLNYRPYTHTQARNATAAAAAAAAFASAPNPDSLLLLRADDLWPLVFAPALTFTWVAVGMLGVLAVWVLILSCTVFRKHR